MLQWFFRSLLAVVYKLLEHPETMSTWTPTDFIHDSSQAVQKGRPARPQRVKARGVPLRYVEGLNDARTPLADFVNSLLDSPITSFWSEDRLRMPWRLPC